MKPRCWLITSLVGLMSLLAACGGDDGATGSTPEQWVYILSASHEGLYDPAGTEDECMLTLSGLEEPLYSVNDSDLTPVPLEQLVEQLEETLQDPMQHGQPWMIGAIDQFETAVIPMVGLGPYYVGGFGLFWMPSMTFVLGDDCEALGSWARENVASNVVSARRSPRWRCVMGSGRQNTRVRAAEGQPPPPAVIPIECQYAG